MKRIFFVLIPAAGAALWYWQVTSHGSLISRGAAVSNPPPASAPAQPPKAGTDIVPAKMAAEPHAPAIRAADVQQKADLASRVALAQRAAIAKYPGLAVAGSEINSRFVFRYKRLVSEHSPRLEDPAWPTQLADECATASGIKVPGPAHKSPPTAVASN